jgi:CheY-like chemotaxis protein
VTPLALARRLRALHASLDEERIVDEVLAAARTLLGADRALLLRATGPGAFAPWRRAAPGGEGAGEWRPAGALLRAVAGGPAVLPPAEVAGLATVGGAGLAAALAAALPGIPEPGGLLVAGSAAPRAFGPEDEALLGELAAHAADALGRARRERAAARHAERLATVARLARRLGEPRPLEDALRMIAAEARRLLGGDAAACRLSEGGELRLAVGVPESAALPGPPAVPPAGDPRAAAGAARPVRIGDAHANGHGPRGRPVDPAPGSRLEAPVVVDGVAVGVLSVQAPAERRFGEDDAALLADLAAQVAIAYRGAREARGLVEGHRLSLVGRIVAGIAHELNNPLAVVIGTAELLRRNVAERRTDDRLRRIAEQARRAIEIVRSLGLLARREPPRRMPVELGRVLDETLELAGYELRSARVTVTRRDEPAVPPVLAARGQLHLLFATLVIEAAESIRASGGSGTVTVTARYDPARDCAVVVVAAEPAPAPVAADLTATLEPPAGAAGARPEALVCRQIVESHGGRMRVESRPGTGTRAIVELPVHGARVPPDPEPAAPGDPGQRGARALLVEDERVVGDLLAEFLALEGYAVDRAANGREALELVRRTRYALIVSDVRMPEVDGQTLYHELRALSPELARRVVFVTGDLMRPETREFLDGTCLRYLSKPFTLPEFQAVIRGVVGAPPDPA